MDKLKAFSKTGRQVLSAEFPLFSVNGKVDFGGWNRDLEGTLFDHD